jgi:hypothetical protein
MDQRGHQGSDLRSKLLARRGGTCWLYNRADERFRPDLDFPESDWPEITFREPAPRPTPAPRWRMGPVTRWLFAHGGMSVVFLGGIMASALIAWALGYR